MREFIEARWCDNLANHDQDREPATTRRTLAFDASAIYEYDLCERCDKELFGPVFLMTGSPVDALPKASRRSKFSAEAETGSRGARQSCRLCPGTFVDRTNLERHIVAAHVQDGLVETVEVTACPLCPATFNRGQDVKRHMSQTHDIDWIERAYARANREELPDLFPAKPAPRSRRAARAS